MQKGFLSLLILGVLVTAFAQVPDKEPKEVIRRLSYENFKNIRLLYTPIMNYGGGEEEFDRLVKTYSEASSLYFSKDFEQAAKKFEENEKQIRESAENIAKKYKEETETWQKEILEKDIKVRITGSISGKDENKTTEKYINQSTESIIRANDYFDRVRPVQAISMYRLSRDRMLTYLLVRAEELPEETIVDCKKNPRDYDKCIKLAQDKQKEEVRQQYEKIIKDNENQVYISKEKEN